VENARIGPMPRLSSSRHRCFDARAQVEDAFNDAFGDGVGSVRTTSSKPRFVAAIASRNSAISKSS